MPPRRQLFSPNFGGFICRSCLSKLQADRHRQSFIYKRFLSRSAANSKRSGGQAQPRTDREVHFFDQTPNGDRVERFVDEEYEEKVEGEQLDEDLKQTIEENKPTMRKIFKSSIPNEYQLSEGLEEFEEAGKQFKDFADKVRSVGDLEKLSPEQRTKLREDLLKLKLFDDQDGIEESNTFKSRAEKDAVEPEDESIPYEVDPNILNQPQYKKYLPSEASEPQSLDRKDKTIDGDYLPDQRNSRRFPVIKFPKPYQNHIKLLQDCLEVCFEHRDQTQVIQGKSVKVTKHMLRSHLARAYMFARKGLLAAPECVPMTMWNDLWQILEANTNENLNRLSYIRRIGEDMDELGFSMSASQHLLYVEALFLDGARKSAIRKWRGNKPRRGSAIWDEYWEIGLRMLAQMGQLDEAFKIAEFFFDDMQNASRYRALMPLIKACLISKQSLSIQRAWALYLRLRVNLGKEMNMKDYDILILWYMDAEQPELALAIFRDMMLSGSQLETVYDSTVLQKVIGIAADFKGIKIDQSELEWESTRTLSVLPAKFKNKFFFGSWIKKLIGDNELNSAKKVLDLMQDHGITPSPMHMNGLIGAWFRRGGEDEYIKADDLAWRMINRRLESMDVRNFRHSLEKPLRPNLNGRSFGDKSAFIFPMATIETFSLLVQQYRQRQKTTSLTPLYTAFVKSRIPPNTRYMNQIILTDTRNHKTSFAFETYRSITARGVKPNYETFILLWNLMKISVDPSVGIKADRQSRNIGTCRNLFAEMMKWKETLIERGEFPRELYDLIVLSFSLKQDQSGAAVALRALQQEFGMFPDENTVRTIVLQLARQGLRNKVGMKPRRLDLSLPLTKDRINSVTEFFHKIRRERAELLLKQGVDAGKLSVEERKEESIITTIEVLRHATMARLFGERRNDFTCTNAAQQAAEQMGVPNCVIWEEESTADN